MPASFSSQHLESQFLSLGNPFYRFSLFTGRSSDDKTAPVVQNIARQAAVILTNDAAARGVVASDLKKLYALRSALVHAGSRAVLSSNANDTEYFAEVLFSRVFSEVDLKLSHAKFIEGLSKTSYGLPWPDGK